MILRAASGVSTLGRYRSTASLAGLLIANAIPLVGVMFFGWSLITVLVLYWIENGIVGLWNIPRIALASGEDEVGTAATQVQNSKAYIIPFFCIHYGIFWFVHGFFLFALSELALFGGFERGFGAVTPLQPVAPLEPALSPWGTLDISAVMFAGLVMLISHGVTFFADYIRRREYEHVSPSRQMFSVYNRVIVLHVAIVLGGFGVAFLGSPIWILVVLIAAKTLFDLSLDRPGGSSATS